MLNSADYYRFSDLYSVCHKKIDQLSFKLLIFSGHIASFKIYQSFESSGFWTFTHVYMSIDFFSDIYIVADEEEKQWALKLHR